MLRTATPATRPAAVAAAVVAATAALLAPVAAHASTVIKCTASVSPSNPARYSHVHVLVRTAAGAYVRATAHYKTTSTIHTAHAASSGAASLDFYISGATAGRRVPVSVTAQGPHNTASCSTGFTPR